MNVSWFIPANTIHWPNVLSMLAHRLRRWSIIELTLGQCLLFAGLPVIVTMLFSKGRPGQRPVFWWQTLSYKVLSHGRLFCPPHTANTTQLPNVWPMLGQRRRRWAGIGQTLSRCVVFAGICILQRKDNLAMLFPCCLKCGQRRGRLTTSIKITKTGDYGAAVKLAIWGHWESIVSITQSLIW